MLMIHTEKNICQILPNYLKTHNKFWKYVHISDNSTFTRISIIEFAKLLIRIFIYTVKNLIKFNRLQYTSSKLKLIDMYIMNN